MLAARPRRTLRLVGFGLGVVTSRASSSNWGGFVGRRAGVRTGLIASIAGRETWSY